MPDKEFQTPMSILQALAPVTARATERKVWGMNLSLVVAFGQAANAKGDAHVPREALGAPLILGRARDGTIRFRDDGKPRVVIAPPIRKFVSDQTQNYISNVSNYINSVMTNMPDAFNAEVEACRKAGQAIIDRDRADYKATVEARQAAEKAAAEKAESEKAASEKILADAKAEADKLLAEAQALLAEAQAEKGQPRKGKKVAVAA